MAIDIIDQSNRKSTSENNDEKKYVILQHAIGTVIVIFSIFVTYINTAMTYMIN